MSEINSFPLKTPIYLYIAWGPIFLFFLYIVNSWRPLLSDANKLRTQETQSGGGNHATTNRRMQKSNQEKQREAPSLLSPHRTDNKIMRRALFFSFFSVNFRLFSFLRPTKRVVSSLGASLLLAYLSWLLVLREEDEREKYMAENYHPCLAGCLHRKDGFP